MSALIGYLDYLAYKKAIEQKCPVNAGINRLLLIQIREADEQVENLQVSGIVGAGQFNAGAVKIGSIYVPKESKETITAKNEVVKAVVKSVGPTHDGRDSQYKENDFVLVFPSVFETKVVLDDVDYFSYSERDIVASKSQAETTVQKRKPGKK